MSGCVCASECVFMRAVCSRHLWGAVTLNLAAELKPQGFTLVAMHPGVVSTDMGNSVTHLVPGMEVLTPQASVAAILKALPGLGLEQCGGFLNYDGSDLAW